LNIPALDYNQAREYQSMAKHWANHTLPFLLDEYFKEINANDEVIYFDKVEINLQDFPWKITAAEWKEKLKNSLSKTTSPTEIFPTIFKQWLFYLYNGCFENTALLKTTRDSEKYVFSNWKYLSNQLVAEVRFNYISPAFLNRLLFQHSKETAISFIEKLLDINFVTAEKLVFILQNELKTAPDNVATIVSKLIELINQQKFTEKQNKIEHIITTTGEPLTELFTNAATEPNAVKPNNKKSIEDVYITCSNTGLVLLFPYLKSFFENNLLLENSEFKNEAAKRIAIQALYFLATGKDAGDEEEYIIPKLLCGVDPNEYVELDEALSDSIKDEAEELLQSVIDHWKILQNTSTDGLREAFLQRNGKLIKRGNQYTLQVAESGVDILLNNIPWGFRNYKLPWMPFTIITEWY
jgi:hypothetical protein